MSAGRKNTLQPGAGGSSHHIFGMPFAKINPAAKRISCTVRGVRVVELAQGKAMETMLRNGP